MAKPGDLEELLSRREDIDRALFERHSREVGLLFTDIVGSTRYFEEKGDIEGLKLVHRHNEVLFPVVTASRGRVVKTIGDAIMAVFETDPADALRCACGMQQALEGENAVRTQAGLEPIRVRIGAHAGRVMVSGNDVFGDTVNTAARISSEAEGEQVLASESLALRVPELPHTPKGAVSLKGKAEPVPIVAVDWRSHGAAAEPSSVAAELFVLELSRGASGLKVAVLDGAADKGTVKAYGEVPLSAADLDALVGRMSAFTRGDAPSYLAQLQDVGAELFRRALSDRAQKRLAETALTHVRLQLDDELVHVPWELLHDGRDFLGLKFAVGRLVSARLETSPGARLDGNPGTRALVVSNPSGDLPGAAREGEAVAGLLKDGWRGEVVHLEGPVTRARFLGALPGCQLVHFAGHARARKTGGPALLQLADGGVSGEELASAFGASPPALVFANSCSSSTDGGFGDASRGVSGLASSLLVRGVPHVLSPLWEVPDEAALAFALRFYERALAGGALGEAAKVARQKLVQGRVPSVAFAGYVLYGDPRTTFAPARLQRRALARTRSDAGAMPALGTPVPAPRPRGKAPLFAAAGALALVAAGVGLVVTGKPAAPAPAPAPVAAPVAPVAEAPKAAKKTGPVRVAVLPFKNLSNDPALDSLKEGLPEAVVTDFGRVAGVQLVERGLIDVDIKELEFNQTAYVDPATRAALGRIQGAELVLLGGFQQAGRRVRAVARVVNAETGEVLATLKAEKPDSELFELQDALAAQAARAVEAAIPLDRRLDGLDRDLGANGGSR